MRFFRCDAPPAVDGQHGDDETLLVLRRAKDMGVPDPTTMRTLFPIYNARCLPAWDERDADRLCRSAFHNAKSPPGVDSPAAVFTPVPAPRTSKFRFAMFNDIEPDLAKPALVQGWLDQGTVSVMYGPPGAAKSFNALHLAFCIATGRPWFGHKVQQGLVVYVALEGGAGVDRRVAALKKHHGVGSQRVPLLVVRGPMNLSAAGKDVDPLVELVHQVEATEGQKAVLVIVDTVARAMAGADENSTGEMNGFIASVDRLGAALGRQEETGRSQSGGAFLFATSRRPYALNTR
jgi:hypothetical protein